VMRPQPKPPGAFLSRRELWVMVAALVLVAAIMIALVLI
jgi:hypothetical protein